MQDLTELHELLDLDGDGEGGDITRAHIDT